MAAKLLQLSLSLRGNLKLVYIIRILIFKLSDSFWSKPGLLKSGVLVIDFTLSDLQKRD